MLKIWANGTIVLYNPSKGRVYSKRQQEIAANTKKTYYMKWKHYRAISSGVVRMFEQRQNNITFWTFTTDGRETYPEAVKMFGKLLDNLKKNYGLVQYIWSGELQKNGNPHFHMIADIPFVQVSKINKAWCKARGYHSNSAVRLPKDKFNKTANSIVKNSGACVRYLCKYMAKQVKSRVDMGARVCAMSKHLTNAYELISDKEVTTQVIQDVHLSGGWQMHINDHAITYSPIGKIEECRELLDSILNYSQVFVDS